MSKFFPRRCRAAALIWTCLALCGLSLACSRNAASQPEVVIYTSVDQRFAAEILAKFTEETGIKCIAVFDTEAGKTTGLVRRLAREAENPRCDVWWSSEVFGTIELARRGVFSPLPEEVVADIPRAWRDKENLWVGFAARARVLAYDAARIDAADVPQSWEELAARESLADVAIANPQFGTTRGHIGALFAYWGPQRATAFLQKLRDDNARVTDGNSQAVMEVLTRGAALGLTDTDDVWVNKGKSETLALVYPTIARPQPLANNRTPRAKRGAETSDGETDDEAPASATPEDPLFEVLWIPNTVARVAGGPNDDSVAQLIAFLASAETEKRIAQSDSRNVPVRAALREKLGIDTTESGEPQAPAFDAIADALPAAMKAAREILLK